MAFSKTFLLLSLAFAVLLVSSEVVSARESSQVRGTNMVDHGFEDGHGHGHGGHGHGGHGGHGHGGHGHGGHGGHPAEETEGGGN